MVANSIKFVGQDVLMIDVIELGFKCQFGIERIHFRSSPKRRYHAGRLKNRNGERFCGLFSSKELDHAAD